MASTSVEITRMKPEKPSKLFGDAPCKHGTYELCSKCLCETIAEKDREIASLKREITRLKEEKEYFISQNRLNSLEVIRLKKELDSRRTA